MGVLSIGDGDAGTRTSLSATGPWVLLAELAWSILARSRVFSVPESRFPMSPSYHRRRAVSSPKHEDTGRFLPSAGSRGHESFSTRDEKELAIAQKPELDAGIGRGLAGGLVWLSP